MSEVLLTGGCQCGETRYAISAAPLRLFACHCRANPSAARLPNSKRERGFKLFRSDASRFSS